MRSLGLVAASVTRIVFSGSQSVVITLAISGHTVAKDILAVITVRITIWIPIPVRISISKPRAYEDPRMEPTAVESTSKSSLRVSTSARDCCNAEKQKCAQKKIANSSQ